MNNKYMKFNLNDTIKGRLLDDGYDHLAALHNEYLGKIPNWDRRDAAFYQAKADEEGYTSFQAWQFIRDFGPTIIFGGINFLDINILIKTD